MKRIEKTWKGLQILSKYSKDIDIQHRCILAGPESDDEVSEKDYAELETMDWVYEEGEGFSILI